MIIPINNKYRLASEKYGGWCIQEYHCVNKEAQTYKWIAILWPGRLDATIKKLAHLEICSSNAEQIQEALTVIDGIAAEFKTALDKFEEKL